MLHWVIVRLSAHPDHPYELNQNIFLKTYVDEDAAEHSDRTYERDGQYAVPSEHSLVMSKLGPETTAHVIEEVEYTRLNSGSAVIYIWIEPYGIAAVSHDSAFSGLMVGRLRLSGAHKTYSGPAGPLLYRPHSVAPDDQVIVFEVIYGKSVAQYIADEMNTNLTDPRLESITYLNREANDLIGGERANETFRRGVNAAEELTYGELGEEFQGQADYEFGHLVHADPHPDHNLFGRLSQRAQEWYFEGGGDWDHKPRIYPVWGSRNRLGNRGLVYRYDIWSNLHYGYIGAHVGFSVQHLIEGASMAQIFDSGSTTDDRADQDMVREGFNLYHRERAGGVSYQDMVNIVGRYPSWLDSGPN